MTDLILLPFVDQLVSAYLRDHSDVTALIDQRVFGNTPANHALTVDPFVRLTQFDELTPTRGWLVGAILQVDCYGGPQALAALIGRTVWAALLQLPGEHDEGVVTGVDLAGWRYNPDVTAAPAADRDTPGARPKYEFVATIHAHPNRATGS